MTSPQEYNELSVDERASILWDEGHYLETWYDFGKFKIMLYAWQNMFVEVYYKLESDKIHEIKAWSNMPMIGRVLQEDFLN